MTMYGVTFDNLRQIAIDNNLRSDPYQMQDIKDLTYFDLVRIERAIPLKDQQKEEIRYFFSQPFVRAIIGTKISSKNKYICSWQVAEAENLLDYYFSGLGEWPEMSLLIVEGSKDENRIRYNNDIEDFYNQRGVTNYKIALEKNELEDYFSGVSFFSQKKSSLL